MAENNDCKFQAIGVISCSNLSSVQIIEKIIGTSFTSGNLFNQTIDNHSISCYPWHISTKYYEADVQFVAIEDRNFVGRQLAESIQAIIIHLDCNDETFYKKFQSWKPFIDEYNFEIRLLVVKTVKENYVINRQTLLKWCIPNEFELIELEPDEETSDEEYENDFKELNGITRIHQALSAHSWPIMTMKNCSPKFKSLLENENESSTSKDKGTEKATYTNEDIDKLNLTKLQIGSIFEEDKEIFEKISDEAELDFDTTLFDKLTDWKKLVEKAETLSGDERRIFAEKVTKDFWLSLGGAADEIEGLDDDDD